MSDSLVKDNQHILVAITLIVVLLLLYIAARGAGYTINVGTPTTKSGFTPGSGAGFWGGRSDGYGDITGTSGVSDEATAMLQNKGKQYAKGQQSGMLSYEPPVFWNAGDMAMIAENQATVAAGGKITDYDIGATEGARNNRLYATAYTEGFNSKILSPY